MTAIPPFDAGGHSILAVPVPAFESLVAARTAHYDPSFLATDAHFTHSHITILAPWSPDPTAAELRAVSQIARQFSAFEVTFNRLAAFDSGVVYAVPEPATQLRQLTEAARAAFPHYIPYGGVFQPRPHVTLDRLGPEVSWEQLNAWAAPLLPATAMVDRLEVQWWQNYNCHLVAGYSLATGAELYRRRATTGSPPAAPESGNIGASR